jgi:hypothetical protein
MSEANAYYFGCLARVGHYLYTQSGEVLWKDAPFPFPISKLDGGFLPTGEQVEGIVHHEIIGGWTVIAFYDRSVDSRLNSNSAFVIRGEKTKEEAIAAARSLFSGIFARFRFEVC